MHQPQAERPGIPESVLEFIASNSGKYALLPEKLNDHEVYQKAFKELKCHATALESL